MKEVELSETFPYDLSFFVGRGYTEFRIVGSLEDLSDYLRRKSEGCDLKDAESVLRDKISEVFPTSNLKIEFDITH